MKRNSKQTTKKLKTNLQGSEENSPQKVSSPHDKFFKEVYSNPKLAVELFKLVIPKEEWSDYDWSGIRFEKDSFKKGLTADLICSLPLKKDPKNRLKIVIILEHKSRYERRIFTQFLYYLTYGHEQSIRQTGRPQPIIPVLFYHGKQAWKWKLSFQEALFGDYLSKIPSSCRENMLNYKMKLLDVQDKSLKLLEDRRFRKSKGILNVFEKIWTLKDKKKITEEDLLKILAKFGVFSTKADNDLVLSIMNYFKSFGVSDKLWERTEQRALRKGIFKKGGYMDVRENIREEGRWEGMQKGRQEGMQKGRQERDKEVILNMLKEKADISFISKVTGLPAKEIKKLKNGA